MQSQENLEESAKEIYVALCIFSTEDLWNSRKGQMEFTIKRHQCFLQNIELYSAFIRIADDRNLQVIYSHFETI